MYRLKFKITSILSICFLSVSTYIYSGMVNAETLVVASQDSVFTSFDSKTAKKLWMGKKRRLEGSKVKIIDQEDGSEAKTEFYQTVLKKSPEQMKAYWAKLVFTGGGKFPPRKLTDDTSMKAWLIKNKDSIGYISASSLDADNSLRILLKIN